MEVEQEIPINDKEEENKKVEATVEHPKRKSETETQGNGYVPKKKNKKGRNSPNNKK